MKLCAAFLLTALVTFQSAGSFAGEEQSNAQTLLERARVLSDIRSPSAPAFRLRSTFTAITRDLTILEGTYTETWVSSTQWRRETVVGASRRVEVGGAARQWLLNSGPPRYAPATAELSPNSPSHRAITAQARQFPMTLTAVRAMSMSASIPRIIKIGSVGR